MPEGPAKKRKTSHGAAAVATRKSHVTIPETTKLSKKSKKSKKSMKEVLVPVVEESQSEEDEDDKEEEEGDGKAEEEAEEEEEEDEEGVKAVVVGEKMETPEIKTAPEPAAVELAVVKSFKELVLYSLTLAGDSC